VTITFTGENTYEITQTEKQITSEFIEKHGQHSLEKVDGETLDPRNFSGLLQGATLFAAAKLVVIKDLAKNKLAWEALGDWLDRVPADTTLILIDPSPDKRTKTYKLLKNKTDFKEFRLLEGSQLDAWVQDFTKNLGGKIGRLETQNLINRVGPDQWRLSAEIFKLVNHDATITLQSVEALVEPGLEGSAFELLDAALAKNPLLVTKLINQLKTQEDPYKFFGLLASQVHSLAIASNAGGKSPDTIAKEAGLHPFVVRKSQSLAGKLGSQKIKQIAAQVAKCDKQLKSTGVDPWDLLSLCLQKIAV
jgi:DNA polymerase-3 subunit delta